MEIVQTESKIVVVADEIHLFALTSAAMIIHECRNFIPDAERKTYPSQGVLEVLRLSTSWSVHGYINALQSHVEFIYAYQKQLMTRQKVTGFYTASELELIARALETYQEWKTALVNSEKEIHGKQWGDATDFNKKKWDENNERFLSLFVKEK